MIHEKNEFKKLDAPFVDKAKDLAQGDFVTIMSEAEILPDQFNPGKTRKVIKIKTRNGARWFNLNQDSANILIDEFKSNNDKDWVGKEAKVLMNKTVIGGKKVIVAYLVGKSWELDEYGSPQNPGVQKEVGQEIPVIQVDEDEINPSEVPF